MFNFQLEYFEKTQHSSSTAAVLFALMARIGIIQNPYLLNLHYFEVYGILRKALWFAKESERVVAH